MHEVTILFEGSEAKFDKNFMGAVDDWVLTDAPTALQISMAKRLGDQNWENLPAWRGFRKK